MITAASRNALRTGVILFVFAVVGTAMLAFTHDRTEPTITRGQLAAKRALLSQVLPATLYDNDLLSSQQSVPPDALLGTRQPSALWIARRGDQVSGLVLEAIAPDGYSGEIALLIGIDIDGNVTGVRVTAHRETPGLGDYIELAKSAWIRQFEGKSLTAPPLPQWKVTKDGGAFDARAGATITPRAVVKAVRNALDFFARHRATLVAPPVAQEKAHDDAE
ncbi:MAG: electron transport complex subunit RsxG [Thiobacillus sp.]|nr:electron transport complex subunit RsxG [Thiobacillus sp.]